MEDPLYVRPRTFRLLSGGKTPSTAVEVRFRFIDSTATAVEDWTVAGPDDLDLAGSGSGYVLCGYPNLNAGDSPCGGVSSPATVLLALSSGQVSVGDDPQSLPSRGNDISMASDGSRVLVVVSQAIRNEGYPIRRMARTATPVDFGLSYQPSLIRGMFIRGWQCGNDSATMASFCPIKLETSSPDASAASIVSLSDADVLFVR